jgi:hypothetical protein
MSPIQYALVILLCVPVFIAIDQNRLILALIFLVLLILPSVVSAFLLELQLRSELKWIVCFSELYWLGKLHKK